MLAQVSRSAKKENRHGVEEGVEEKEVFLALACARQAKSALGKMRGVGSGEERT
jgi:hypothetical protein